MYPDFSYIMHALIGTQPDNGFSIIKTFGLLLACAFFVAGYVLYIELKRKEKQGLLSYTESTTIIGEAAKPRELIMNAIVGFIVGAKLLYIAQNFDAFKADGAGVLFSARGSLIGGIAGAIAFAAYVYWGKRSQQLDKPVVQKAVVKPSDRVGDMTIIAAISGIIGAKVFALIEDLPSFFADPIGTFFSGSGLAIYGGLIGGFVGVFFYLKKYNINYWHVMDSVAPALILAYGVGRLGCHFSGDGDWGIVAGEKPAWWFLPDWLWSFDYPHNVNKDGVPLDNCTWQYCTHLAEKVFPTSIYEFVMALVIFGILWALRKRITIPGVLFFIYLIFNGLERFLIETIRVNHRYENLFNLTQAEIIAILFFLIGTTGIFLLWNRAKANKAG
jgi:phosphatidylglycerol:prolipoprotein diacylglycerol transferase